MENSPPSISKINLSEIFSASVRLPKGRRQLKQTVREVLDHPALMYMSDIREYALYNPTNPGMTEGLVSFCTEHDESASKVAGIARASALFRACFIKSMKREAEHSFGEFAEISFLDAVRALSILMSAAFVSTPGDLLKEYFSTIFEIKKITDEKDVMFFLEKKGEAAIVFPESLYFLYPGFYTDSDNDYVKNFIRAINGSAANSWAIDKTGSKRLREEMVVFLMKIIQEKEKHLLAKITGTSPKTPLTGSAKTLPRTFERNRNFFEKR